MSSSDTRTTKMNLTALPEEALQRVLDLACMPGDLVTAASLACTNTTLNAALKKFKPIKTMRCDFSDSTSERIRSWLAWLQRYGAGVHSLHYVGPARVLLKALAHLPNVVDMFCKLIAPTELYFPTCAHLEKLQIGVDDDESVVYFSTPQPALHTLRIIDVPGIAITVFGKEFMRGSTKLWTLEIPKEGVLATQGQICQFANRQKWR